MIYCADRTVEPPSGADCYTKIKEELNEMSFVSYLLNGVSLGSVYAIIALGYTMVYGIAKMLNFAHGDVIMIGSYVAFVAINSMGLPIPVSILISVAACTVLGMTIERVAYKPLRHASKLAVLVYPRISNAA